MIFQLFIDNYKTLNAAENCLNILLRRKIENWTFKSFKIIVDFNSRVAKNLKIIYFCFESALLLASKSKIEIKF